MTIEQDIWTDDQVTMFKHYSLSDDAGVKKMISENPDLAFLLIQNFMGDKLSNSLMRERIVAKNSCIRHSFSMHDYDGYDTVLNRPVEIKNEQHTSGGRRDQIVGGAAFSGIEDYAQIQRLVKDNPIIMLSGWIDGRLAYTVQFDFNDTRIAQRLTGAVDSRKNGNKTAPKFLWSDWANAKSLVMTQGTDNLFKLKGLISSKLYAKLISLNNDRLNYAKSTIFFNQIDIFSDAPEIVPGSENPSLVGQ